MGFVYKSYVFFFWSEHFLCEVEKKKGNQKKYDDKKTQGAVCLQAFFARYTKP